MVVLERRRRVVALEDGGEDHGHQPSKYDPHALHGEHRRYECTPRLFVGVLGHDGGRQWVVPADAEAQPEPEEAERADDGLGGASKGEAGTDGAEGHEDQGDAVHLLAAKLVAQPAEEELAGEGPD